MPRAKTFLNLLSTAGLSALSLPGIAMAQSVPPANAAPPAAQANELQDIVVTARKTPEVAQAIPLQVNVLSAEALEQRSVRSLKDIAATTPGFTYENLTGGLGAPTIRGQTQTNVANPVQNVASFFDGVYLQRSYMVDASLLDIERVEIVKGPQSALYGRNAFSGAINYVTRAPADHLEVDVNGTVGSYDRYDFGGSVSTPLLPGLSVRVAGEHSEFDGTWDNNHPLAGAAGATTKGRAGGYNNNAYMLSVAMRPTSDLSIDVTYSRTDLNVEAQPSYVLSTNQSFGANYNTVNCSPLPNVGATGTATVQNRLFCGEIPAKVSLAPGETRLPGVLLDPRSYGQHGINDIVALRTEYRLSSALTLNYLFGYTHSNVTSLGNSQRDMTIPAFTVAIFPPYSNDVTFDSQPNGYLTSYQNDLRLTYQAKRLRIMAGAFYSLTNDLTLAYVGGGIPLTLGPVVSILPLTSAFRHDRAYSGYGMIEYAVVPALKLSAEGRYTREDQSYDDRLAIAANRNVSDGYLQKQRENYFTPRFAADYAVSPGHNLYASAAKGEKAGGFNGGPYFFASQFATVCPGITRTTATIANCAGAQNVAQQAYLPEKNWTYEIGSKNEFFNRRLRLNISAYYVDWTNLQINVVRADSGVVSPTVVPTITGNIGGVHVKGIEVEGEVLATRHLRVNYGFDYHDARYTSDSTSQRFAVNMNCDGIVCPASGSLAGKQVQREPATTATGGATYSGQFGRDTTWFVRGDITYQSRSYVDEEDLAYVPSRTLVNARAGVTLGPVDLQIWGKNLFDVQYVTAALYQLGGNGLRSSTYTPFLGERRTIGLTAKAHF